MGRARFARPRITALVTPWFSNDQGKRNGRIQNLKAVGNGDRRAGCSGVGPRTEEDEVAAEAGFLRQRNCRQDTKSSPAMRRTEQTIAESNDSSCFSDRSAQSHRASDGVNDVEQETNGNILG